MAKLRIETTEPSPVRGTIGPGSARVSRDQRVGKPRPLPRAVLVEFNFDQEEPRGLRATPGSLATDALPEGIEIQPWGPGAWKISNFDPRTDHLELEWLSAGSEVRVVRAVSAPASLDAMSWSEDHKTIRDDARRDSVATRFMVDLEFGTTLLRSQGLRTSPTAQLDLDYARATLQVSERSLRNATPGVIESDVEPALAVRSAGRARLGRSKTVSRKQFNAMRSPRITGVSGLAALGGIAEVFEACIARNYERQPGESLGDWLRSIRSGVLEFSGGLAARASTMTRSESTGDKYNAEPNGTSFFLFAELADEVVLNAPKLKPRPNLRLWKSLRAAFVVGIEAMIDVYWDRTAPRTHDAYAPIHRVKNGPWSAAAIQQLEARIQGFDSASKTLDTYWRCILALALADA